MKRLITKLFAAGMLISAAALMFTSCTKEGPQGPTGPAGKDGTNGQDANATCTQCHNFSDSIVAKIFQYNGSQHATGSTAFENRKTCAPCHTSQGFIECVATGSDTTANEILDPAPINCRTCHNIHATYTYADWAVKTTASYTLRIDHSITMNFPGNGGTGNLCGRCHQARTTSPWVTNPTGTDSLKVSSMRWGPHYGGQSLVLGGKGAFEFGTPYTNTSHKDNASCTSCHGAKAVGDLTGGHSLWIGNEEEGDNLFGCNITGCHNGNMTQAKMEEKQLVIEEKLTALQDALIAKKIIDSVTHYVLVPKKYTQKQLAVVWNYKLVYYDRSMGMHNYAYTSDMLDASLAALNQ
jgi:hypothetical protein